MESTNGQTRVNGCIQEQSVGVDAVVGHNMALLSSLEDHNTEQKQMPSRKMGEESNSDAATVWPPERIEQTARHTNISHPATKTDGEWQRITMLNVTDAISVSLANLSSANFCLTRLSGQHRRSTGAAFHGQKQEECGAGDAFHRPPQ